MTTAHRHRRGEGESFGARRAKTPGVAVSPPDAQKPKRGESLASASRVTCAAQCEKNRGITGKVRQVQCPVTTGGHREFLGRTAPVTGPVFRARRDRKKVRT